MCLPTFLGDEQALQEMLQMPTRQTGELAIQTSQSLSKEEELRLQIIRLERGN